MCRVRWAGDTEKDESFCADCGFVVAPEHVLRRPYFDEVDTLADALSRLLSALVRTVGEDRTGVLARGLLVGEAVTVAVSAHLGYSPPTREHARIRNRSLRDDVSAGQSRRASHVADVGEPGGQQGS